MSVVVAQQIFAIKRIGADVRAADQRHQRIVDDAVDVGAVNVPRRDRERGVTGLVAEDQIGG